MFWLQRVSLQIVLLFGPFVGKERVRACITLLRDCSVMPGQKHMTWSVFAKRIEAFLLSSDFQTVFKNFQIHMMNLSTMLIWLTYMIVVDTLFKDFEGSQQAEYWISFMEMVEILTQSTHVIRTSNWTEFKSSLNLMLPWMWIYDNDTYGRHLLDFTAVLDQAAFKEYGMLRTQWLENHSCVALDIWIEPTMNKGSKLISKLKSGWLAIPNNEKQLLSKTRNSKHQNFSTRELQ